MHPTLDPPALLRALSVRDLTDPAQGAHAMQQLLDAIEDAVRAPRRDGSGDDLSAPRGLEVRRHRPNPVVAVADNYDRLGYPPDAAARDARYSRYITKDVMLRSHTTAGIPAVLDALPAEGPDEVVLSLPGLAYRRDVIDRHHVGEPHQLDLWWLRRTRPPLDQMHLHALVATVVGAALPGARWRATPTTHPYTHHGHQIDVHHDGRWVEVGECGLADPAVLMGGASTAATGRTRSGLTGATAVASGWGLDRLLMLRKGLPDLRLLRAEDPRVAAQMADLTPYRPVSAMPATTRDLSVAVAPDASATDRDLIGDRVRTALGADAEAVEELEVLSATPGEALTPAARRRLGLRPGQVNLLVRVVLRPLDRTLTTTEANQLRDRIYAVLHQGATATWAAAPGATPEAAAAARGAGG